MSYLKWLRSRWETTCRLANRRRRETMSYLKWLLLFVCVVYVAWPLLISRPDRTRRKGGAS